MYKLIRIFNQNRRQILIAILAIVFVLVILRVLNSFAQKTSEEKLQNLLIASNEIDTSTYNPSYSIVSGTKISDTVNKAATTIIDEFIKKCNEGKIEEAYSMLSKDCKEEVYKTLEDFREYYKRNFISKKDYTVQLWVANSLTYKVEFVQDALSVGKINDTEVFQDFYTIVIEDGEERLNISEYIGKVEIEKSSSSNGITIKVNYKNVFKDYEIYNVTIENNTQNNILLDSLESTKNVYLKGSKDDAIYSAYLYEINDSNFKINKTYKKTLDIKFNKQYTSKTNVTSIVFSDIILNSEEYESLKNKKEYTNRTSIRVAL